MSLITFTHTSLRSQDIINKYNVIPCPNQLIPQQGQFVIDDKVVVNTSGCTSDVKTIAGDMISKIGWVQNVLESM